MSDDPGGDRQVPHIPDWLIFLPALGTVLALLIGDTSRALAGLGLTAFLMWHRWSGQP